MTGGFNLSAWALQNRPLVKVAMAISLLAGLLAFQKLGRLEDPNFEIPLMTALVAWPGATPDEIQNQILNRMEQSVQCVWRFAIRRRRATRKALGSESAIGMRQGWREVDFRY